MASTPAAVDAKGHVSAIGDLVAGARRVDFDIRHGPTVTLHVTDGTMAARLRAAMLGGECLEIIHERSAGPSDGLILAVS